ncbi:hypothetical protein F5887DRAFT_951833 [Amanita rubescens]|nr:hypothetical protein F5887DRAFT_967709 [Amanita rubescens]KAF8348771.1 hypothetical protein F5887DRAFT_951833 [Amanita rubescens]
MSFLRRIWQSIRSPRIYTGRDFEGNRFYEHPATSPDQRTRREVQYRQPDDMWDYIGGGKRLPAQWSSWLTHTRQYPPTFEELQADFDRQQRVKMNAALIDARDNENRAKLIAEGAVAVEEAHRMTVEQATEELVNQRGPLGYHLEVSTDGDKKELREEMHSEQEQVEQAQNSVPASPLNSTGQSKVSPWVEHTEDTPNSWTPLTRRRGE